jgi:hypothetical protein
LVGKATDATEANGADKANAVDKAAAVEAEASVTNEAKARVADEAEIDKAADFLTDDADANIDEVDEANDIVKTAEANNSNEAIKSDEADDANKVNKAIALDEFDLIDEIGAANDSIMIDEVVLGLLAFFLPFSLTNNYAIIFTEVKDFFGINNNQLGGPFGGNVDAHTPPFGRCCTSCLVAEELHSKIG